MGRSVHTRPKRILAAARLRAPYERRGAAGVTRAYRKLRLAKEAGMPETGAERTAVEAPCFRLPRISVAQSADGWHYPIDPADIARLLRFFGPEVIYGLRSISLSPSPAPTKRLRFGSLIVPGEIRLFAQPPPPWLLHGSIPSEEIRRLTRAGAVVNTLGGGLQTVVKWPGDTLRDFFLFDVLMHEVGHHIVQQYTGKRRARVRRTSDHEVFADRFARRCRQEYGRS
jgi:hypothetical protein